MMIALYLVSSEGPVEIRADVLRGKCAVLAAKFNSNV